MKIIFAGTPQFAASALSALLETEHQIVAVLTQPDRPSGRGMQLTASPVKQLALQHAIPIWQPETLKAEAVRHALHELRADVMIVAAYGLILPSAVLQLPRLGCLNIHASLLPRWRGAAPIHAAILAGDEETGVTIMQMDAGLDTGAILAQRAIRLTRDDTAGSASRALSALGADLLLATLPDFLAGKLTPTPQPAEGVTYAPMLKKEDGRLDFTRPAEELARRVRAMNPWPGAWFEYNGEPLKVLKARAEIIFTYMIQMPGTRLVVGNQPVVATSNNFLFLEEVQPPGKKPMDGKAFLSGARDWK